MNFTIKKLSDDCDTKIRVRNFLFSQIRSEYGYGYIPSWHKDIIDLNKYYIDCRKNDLFFVENNDDGRIIASMAIRQYDKDFPEFRDIYSRETRDHCQHMEIFRRKALQALWTGYTFIWCCRGILLWKGFPWDLSAYPEESCCGFQFLEKSGVPGYFGY